jgi:hypothetical protein
MKAGERWLAASARHFTKTLCCFQHLDHVRQTVTPSLNNQQQQQLLKQQALATSSPHNNDVSMTHSPAAPNNHTPPGSVGQSHMSPAGQLVSKSIAVIRKEFRSLHGLCIKRTPNHAFLLRNYLTDFDEI